MREVDAVNVVTQTFLGFSKLNITGSNLYDGKLLANSFKLKSLDERKIRIDELAKSLPL